VKSVELLVGWNDREKDKVKVDRVGYGRKFLKSRWPFGTKEGRQISLLSLEREGKKFPREIRKCLFFHPRIQNKQKG